VEEIADLLDFTVGTFRIIAISFLAYGAYLVIHKTGGLKIPSNQPEPHPLGLIERLGSRLFGPLPKE
jgi:hypothetical protein